MNLPHSFTLDEDTQVLLAVDRWRRAGHKAMLVTVVRTWGSSPRPPGSLLAIRQDGLTAGSVSGGCIEDDLIRRGASQGLPLQKPELVRYGVSAEDARKMGLPCGGTIELVCEPVTGASRLEELLNLLTQRKTVVRELNLRTGMARLAASVGDGASLDDQVLRTFHGPGYRLIVIGTGDLSEFLCRMAMSLGFDVTVCDPRLERHEAYAVAGAHLSREMPDDLVVRMKPDARTAVVALTHDPKIDDLALMEALASEAFYVGAIGSRRNNDARRLRLQEHFGLTHAQLARMHGPIGLYIGSRTPHEIAVSIVAQLVAARNGVHPESTQDVASAKNKLDLEAAPVCAAVPKGVDEFNH